MGDVEHPDCVADLFDDPEVDPEAEENAACGLGFGTRRKREHTIWLPRRGNRNPNT